MYKEITSCQRSKVQNYVLLEIDLMATMEML